MSLEVHQQSFKMNSDFWPRGPPGNNFPMMDQTDFHQQRNQQQSSSGFHGNNNNNNDNNNAVDLKDHLISGQENQNNFNQSQSGFQINPAPVESPGADNSSPESKFSNDKFVNEIQVSFHLRLWSFLALVMKFSFGAKILASQRSK